MFLEIFFKKIFSFSPGFLIFLCRFAPILPKICKFMPFFLAFCLMRDRILSFSSPATVSAVFYLHSFSLFCQPIVASYCIKTYILICAPFSFFPQSFLRVKMQWLRIPILCSRSAAIPWVQSVKGQKERDAPKCFPERPHRKPPFAFRLSCLFVSSLQPQLSTRYIIRSKAPPHRHR